MPSPTETKRLLKEHAVHVAGATLTVGTETDDVINVAIQLTDVFGADLASIGVVHAYISDSATGDGIASSAPSGGVAIGTDGSILAELVTDKLFVLQSESDGDIDLDITGTSGSAGAEPEGPLYLVVILPTGETVVSDAIEFVAD